VVIPCFNDGATLGDTVESVLQQESCELVVVDDGSTDPETLRVCDELRARGITVLRQENKGLSAARMKGVAATSASYVYPIDSDDMLVPGALTELADALDREPDNVAAAWGRTVTFGDMDMLYRRAITTIDAWRVTHSAGLPYAALFRRDALLAVGGWSLRGGYEDWDLWMALAEHGYDGCHVPAYVLRYRVHGQRMWADAMARHELIYAELRRRHPALFADRWQAWRRSREPWRVRLLFPLIGALPLISSRMRLRGYTIAGDPRRAVHLAVRRLRNALRHRRG